MTCMRFLEKVGRHSPVSDDSERDPVKGAGRNVVERNDYEHTQEQTSPSYKAPKTSSTESQNTRAPSEHGDKPSTPPLTCCRLESLGRRHPIVQATCISSRPPHAHAYRQHAALDKTCCLRLPDAVKIMSLGVVGDFPRTPA